MAGTEWHKKNGFNIVSFGVRRMNKTHAHWTLHKSWLAARCVHVTCWVLWAIINIYLLMIFMRFHMCVCVWLEVFSTAADLGCCQFSVVAICGCPFRNSYQTHTHTTGFMFILARFPFPNAIQNINLNFMFIQNTRSEWDGSTQRPQRTHSHKRAYTQYTYSYGWLQKSTCSSCSKCSTVCVSVIALAAVPPVTPAKRHTSTAKECTINYEWDKRTFVNFISNKISI